MRDFRVVSAAGLCFLLSCSAMAQAPVIATPSNCAAMSERAIGVKLVPATQSLSDLSVELARGQEQNLALISVSLLTGPCADQVHAFSMSQIVFDDGTVFTATVKDQYTFSPGQTGLMNVLSGAVAADYPAMAQARFVMASKADAVADKRALHVGLWETSDGYLVAAYIRQEGRVSAPVELLRSQTPIKSVTYFPALDVNAGRLGLLANTESGVVMVSLDWNHVALSKLLRSGE